MRRILGLLIAADRREFSGAVGVAVASGAASALLVAIIGQAATRQGEGPLGLVAVFAALVVATLVMRIASQLLLLHLVQGTVYRLRLDLCRQIIAAPLVTSERLGPARLLATLTDDVQAVADAVQGMPFLCFNLATLVGCLAYLCWLSPLILVGTVVVSLPGVWSYRLVGHYAIAAMRRGRARYDYLIEHFRAVTEGTKELKLHAPRRAAFLAEALTATADDCRREQFRGLALYSIAGAWTQLWLMLWLGLMLFALPRLRELETPVLVAYCLTVLYMLRPLDFVLHFLPIADRAGVALAQVEALGMSLRTASAEPTDAAPAPRATTLAGPIRLAGAVHRYQNPDDDRSFTLGPVDLEVRPGEILFLTGGNGSGKSTLAKLLTGLYPLAEGTLAVAGRPLAAGDLDDYRQLFSAVFADTFLFDHWYGLGAPPSTRVEEHLRRLRLAGRVTVSADGIDPRGLSQGQRKRLALVALLLEDRPVCVFDEWASDQDPAFKEFFYRHLLDELKARGKAVVVISHDDRYFDAADRLVKLEDGRVVGGS